MGAQPPHSLNLTNLPKPKPSRRGRREWMPPLDWTAGHGPVTGALSATTGAAAVALFGAATSMPPGWPMAAGAAGALGHGVGHTLIRRMTGRTLATRTASWLLAGGWTTWAMTTGPLSWAAAGTLATLGVGIGAMASHAAIWEEAVEEERISAEAREAARKLSAGREAVAREWEARIKRVTGIDVRVFAVETWATGAGFSLAAELPGGAATWDRIAAAARALATDARLPLGCTVGVEEGDRQGRVVLDIATRNVMAGSYDYPDDYSALSILTGIPWGLLPNSETVQVVLREACALILGPPGAGKSTFLDVVLAGFARCTDVLTFLVDLKAGAAGMSWVRPWLEALGRARTKPGTARPPQGTRPGVDWLAATPEEALRMFKAALAINAARQLGYQDLMDREDTTLLPVSAAVPQIMIVVDEGAELLSATSFRDPVMKALQEAVKKTMRTTRAMGIRLVLTAVDGNVSALGDTSVRKFSPVGVALTSGESSGNNLAKLFPAAKADTRQLTAKGCGVIGQAGADGFAPTGFKGWRTSPAMVRQVVLATNDRRPVLDPVSARAAGEDYARRWEADRAGWLWQHPGNDTGEETGPKDDSVYAAEPPARTGGLNLSYQRPAPGPAEDADALADRFMREIDATYGTTDEPHPTPPQPERPPGLNLSYQRRQPPPQNAAAGGPDWLPEAVALIAAAGPAGMKPSAVADAVGRDRKTVRAALRAAADRGELAYRDNGPHSVYVHPDHT
ncbi:hypothetical protein LO771_06325 [Streptacidiphilus sp. ASG 303]|uniref:hypothetical protein n=1 Tax=Streptacidiphilus sp. ASG 303 TaxID=2896847 RepID=UPI001E2F5F98|nr:hypothetical protein [Streptacidiphilus sp. ASG 303]MCD0482041.1 hypothetical protein [Streptacidiphilus sp. ASG 303]